MLERRNAPRGRTFIGGKVDFNNSFCVVDCLVRNMSETGARLTFADTAVIPDQFDLRLPQKNQIRRARLIWRHHDQVGINFVEQTPRANVVSFEHARRLKNAEADRERLQRRIDDLLSRY